MLLIYNLDSKKALWKLRHGGRKGCHGGLIRRRKRWIWGTEAKSVKLTWLRKREGFAKGMAAKRRRKQVRTSGDTGGHEFTDDKAEGEVETRAPLLG